MTELQGHEDRLEISADSGVFVRSRAEGSHGRSRVGGSAPSLCQRARSYQSHPWDLPPLARIPAQCSQGLLIGPILTSRQDRERLLCLSVVGGKVGVIAGRVLGRSLDRICDVLLGGERPQVSNGGSCRAAIR